jgi:hypothetical protein
MKTKIMGVLVAALLLAGMTVGTSPRQVAKAQSPAGTLPVYSTVFVNAEGLDSCPKHSTKHWNLLFRQKLNLWGLGFYLGGVTAATVPCYKASKAWVTNIANGYKLEPIYDSLQAPCSTTQTHRMSSNGDTAHRQGIQVASHAIGRMTDLNISAATIIYLDIEGYPDSCRGPVKRFVDGWVHELHMNAFKAGLYSSACAPHLNGYHSIKYPPDDVAIADWNGKDSAFGVHTGCVSNSFWHNRRIHQYTKNSTVTLKENGKKVHLYPVDHECLRGQLDGTGGYDDKCGYPNG